MKQVLHLFFVYGRYMPHDDPFHMTCLRTKNEGSAEPSLNAGAK